MLLLLLQPYLLPVRAHLTKVRDWKQLRLLRPPSACHQIRHLPIYCDLLLEPDWQPGDDHSNQFLRLVGLHERQLYGDLRRLPPS